MHEALTTRKTKGGLHVLRLHYAADEEKDPSTELGGIWLKHALTGYPLGLDDPNWRKEMEIQYSAGGGADVFQKFSEWRMSSNIFIAPEPDLTGARLYGSYDYGFTNPSCYLVHANYPGGLKRTIWEFYAPEVPVSQQAEIILGKSVTLSDGRSFEGNPYAGREVMKIADPEIGRRTQVMSNSPNRSVNRIFQDSGVFFIMGERGDDSMVANHLLGSLWGDPQSPTYQICTNCKYLIWELANLKHPKSNSNLNKKEIIVDRNNHAWDALKYFLKRFPVVNKEKEKKSDVGTFLWWCKTAENYASGKPIPAFKRDMVR